MNKSLATIVYCLAIPILNYGSAETFTKVELKSNGKVFITQSDSNSIEINTSGSKDEIETEIKNSTLVISSSVHADYRITMKSVEALSVSGTGEIIVTNTINPDKLELEVSGNGKM